jgi:hypothetical protein
MCGIARALELPVLAPVGRGGATIEQAAEQFGSGQPAS